MGSSDNNLAVVERLASFLGGLKPFGNVMGFNICILNTFASRCLYI